MNMDFYERVKELVKIRKDSLISFLQSLNINYETYKSAKRLGNLPRTEESLAIAKALGTTVEYLVTGKEDNSAKESLKELKQKIMQFAESVQ